MSVAQTVESAGMPPTTPACDQSMARVGSMMPDQGSALGEAPLLLLLPLEAPLLLPLEAPLLLPLDDPVLPLDPGRLPL
jgi:hypothetical protein